MGEPDSGNVGGAEGVKPAQYYPPCTRQKLVVAPMLGWNHAGTLLSYAVNAKHILEYGSGGSTLWLSQHTAEDVCIVSVEHDPEWLRRVGKIMIQSPALVQSHKIAMIDANATPPYVRPPYIEKYVPYDLIFIDGKHDERTPCLKAAYDLLSPGGVVILDNSEEPAYQEGKTFLLAQPGMVLIEETEDITWNPNRSRRKMWVTQKRETNHAS